MALEDVVQSVEVQVNVTGADEAEARIGKLGESIQGLSEAANDAMTGRGGGGGGGGIKGLDDAFKNIGTTAAASFAQILSGVTSGNLTGLATLMGGPVAGSFTAAAEQISAFIDQQDAAILKTASMAKQFHTTPDAIQGMSAALGEAGVSTQGFERLVNRMAQRVATDYSSMMRNIRTDNDTAESAALRLTKAQEALQESYGVPKEAFAAQDKYIEQRERSIAVDQAQEAVREQALKSIPHITSALKEGMTAGKQMADVAEADINTLTKSFENMSRVGTGPADPMMVMKNLMEAIRTGAIDDQKALALLKTEMGSMRAQGVAGQDPQRFIEFAHNDGWQKFLAAQREIREHGLGLTDTDIQKARDATTAGEKFGEVWSNVEKKSAAALSPIKTAMENFASDKLLNFVDNVRILGDAWHRLGGTVKDNTPGWFSDWLSGKDSQNRKNKTIWDALGMEEPEWLKKLHPATAAAAPPPAAPGASGAPPGTSPVRVVRFGMGAPPGGTAEIYHVPKEGEDIGHGPGVGVEQTSGAARIYHMPGSPGGGPLTKEEKAAEDARVRAAATAKPATHPLTSIPGYEHMSILDMPEYGGKGDAAWLKYAGLPPDKRAAAMRRDLAPPTGFPAPGEGTPTGFPGPGQSTAATAGKDIGILIGGLLGSLLGIGGTVGGAAFGGWAGGRLGAEYGGPTPAGPGGPTPAGPGGPAANADAIPSAVQGIASGISGVKDAVPSSVQETAGSISGVKDAIPGAITDVASAISAAMSQIKGETPAGAPTPAPASTPAPSGAWRGGLIGNSAFASGGLVGFDDGGSTDKPVPPTSAPPAPAAPSGSGFLAKAANVAGRLFSGIGNAAVNAAKLPGDVRSGKFNVTPEKSGMWSETDQWRQDRSNKIAFGRSVDLAGGIAAGMRGFGAEGSTADLLGTTQKGTGAPLDPTGGSDKSSWQKLLGYWTGGIIGMDAGGDPGDYARGVYGAMNPGAIVGLQDKYGVVRAKAIGSMDTQERAATQKQLLEQAKEEERQELEQQKLRQVNALRNARDKARKDATDKKKFDHWGGGIIQYARGGAAPGEEELKRRRKMAALMGLFERSSAGLQPGETFEQTSAGMGLNETFAQTSAGMAPGESFERSSAGFWLGGNRGVPGFAQGSIKGPGTGTSDSILARLSNGEFVMKAASVRAYGEGFMHALNNIQIPPPKYAMGGMVPASSVPRLADGGAASPQHVLNLTIGDQEFKGMRAPDAVAQQLKTYALDQATTSTGRKPSWVG